MPKLYFRYGTMNSSKTANLLMVAHNYEMQGGKVILLKPCIDTRFGEDIVKSRAGFSKECDFVLHEHFDVFSIDLENVRCVLVDECQFVLPKHIEQLRFITEKVPVMCYGLKSDYKTKLFPGSKRLLELADSIEEVKTICTKCNKKAIINAKFTGSKIIKEGSSKPDLGMEDKYQAMCWACWNAA